MSDDSKDMLRIKPYDEALHTVVEKSFEDLETFTSITCKPGMYVLT